MWPTWQRYRKSRVSTSWHPVPRGYPRSGRRMSGFCQERTGPGTSPVHFSAGTISESSLTTLTTLTTLSTTLYIKLEHVFLQYFSKAKLVSTVFSSTVTLEVNSHDIVVHFNWIWKIVTRQGCYQGVPVQDCTVVDEQKVKVLLQLKKYQSSLIKIIIGLKLRYLEVLKDQHYSMARLNCHYVLTILVTGIIVGMVWRHQNACIQG